MTRTADGLLANSCCASRATMPSIASSVAQASALKGPCACCAFVERAQVQRHEAGLESAQNLESIARLHLVAGDRGVVAVHVGAGRGLQLLDQRVGPRQRRHQQPVVGIRAEPKTFWPRQNSGISQSTSVAPTLTGQPTLAVRRPALVRSLPQRRHANLRPHTSSTRRRNAARDRIPGCSGCRARRATRR